MFTPGQVSETLSTPASTLRRWAKVFESHISPQTGSHRAYTLEDINTFRKVKEMLGQGFTYEAVKKNLDIVETPEDQTKDLATLPDMIQALQIATDQLATLQTQADHQDKRIKDLENWIRLPWYKRLFTKPPNMI